MRTGDKEHSEQHLYGFDAFASEQETQHFETVDDCEHTRNSEGTRDATTEYH